MNDPDIDARGRLVELSTEECLTLLDASAVGRVAWCTREGPVVVPVNYVRLEDAVWISTSAYSALSRQADGTTLALEIDEIDASVSSGWSVLVRGRAERHSGDQVPADLARPLAWPAGQHPVVVRIEVNELSGRRLLPR